MIHSTDIRAIAGGSKFGVAKEATIYSVKVLGVNNPPPDHPEGPYSDV